MRARRLLAIFIVPLLPPTLFGAVILQDDFSYADGALTNVSHGKWQVTDPQTGIIEVSSGRIFLIGEDNREDVHSDFLAAPYTPESGAVLYATLTINCTNRPSGRGAYFAHLRGDSNTHYCRIFALAEGSTLGFFRVGIANYKNNSESANAIVPRKFALHSDHQILVRYVVSNAVSTIWVNSFAESDGVSASDAASPIPITSFGFRQATGMGSLFADNLSVTNGFRLNSISQNSGMLALRWQSVSGAVYSVETSSNLTNWVAFATNLAARGATVTFTTNISASSGFFRVHRLP